MLGSFFPVFLEASIMSRILLSFLLFISSPTFAAEATLTSPSVVLFQTETPFQLVLTTPTAVQGDLYLATVLSDQQLYFLTADMGLQTSPIAFAKNQSFSGQQTVLSIPYSSIPAGIYPVYQVITAVNQSPFDTTAWLTSVQNLQFTVGLPPHISHDENRDGIADSDCNGNGLADDAVDCEKQTLSNSSFTSFQAAGKTLYEKYCDTCHDATSYPAAQFPELIRTSPNYVDNNAKKAIISRLTDDDLDKIASYMGQASSQICRLVSTH